MSNWQVYVQTKVMN